MATEVAGFILAAGEGRRLRPATLVRPKALVPFCGVPLLELTASFLHEAGIRQIIVNACYQGDRVTETCQRLNEQHGWDLRVSHESHLLNAGGGLRKGIQLLPDVEHFLVHNADVVMDYDLRPLIRRHLESNAAVTVLLVKGRGPCTVSLNSDGSIRTFRDPKKGTHTFACIHIFHRSVLKFLEEGREDPDIIVCYQRALDAGLPVHAVCVEPDAWWTDIGSPKEYIRAHGEVADCAFRHHSLLQQAQTEQANRRFALELQGVQCTGALGLGQALHVPAGSHLHNAVLWDYTCLPRPLLYADGIFVGNDVPPARPVDDSRKPDPRVFSVLGLNPADCTLEALHKQGSGRKYNRLRCGERSWVWCAYNPERRENAGFAAIADFLLRLGLNVPRVDLHLADSFELVSQDLGQSDLHLVPQTLQEKYLYQAVRQIAVLHVIGDRKAKLEELPLQRGFTKGLYDWERDYFRTHILDRLLHAPELWGEVALEYTHLRSMLLSEPLVPIHRDFQSANLKIMDDQVYLIDFQGMRLGCAAYDVASLLYDPYQCLSAEVRARVWQEYCQAVHDLGGTPPKDSVLHAAACQRLMQALGAYGKLWRQDGLEWYRQFISPGVKMLAEAAAPDLFPALHRLTEQLCERIAPSIM
ncbi:MAG: NTP transferase domain-containing protein [Victivallales bacterium]|nr:NTP transferase domain-containing protein [Victivallales bacterium]